MLKKRIEIIVFLILMFVVLQVNLLWGGASAQDNKALQRESLTISDKGPMDEDRLGESILSGIAGIPLAGMPDNYEFSFIFSIKKKNTGKEDGFRKVTEKGNGRKGFHGWRVDTSGDLGEFTFCRNELYRLFYSADMRKFYMRNVSKNEPFGEILLAAFPLVAGESWSFMEALALPWTWIGTNYIIDTETKKAGEKKIVRVKRRGDGDNGDVRGMPSIGGTEELELIFTGGSAGEHPEKLSMVRYLDKDGRALSTIDFGRSIEGGSLKTEIMVKGSPGNKSFSGRMTLIFDNHWKMQSLKTIIKPDSVTEITFDFLVTPLDKPLKELFRFRPPAGTGQMDAFSLTAFFVNMMDQKGLR